jgi:hypothetical protein
VSAFCCGAKTLEKLFCRVQSQNRETELVTESMLIKCSECKKDVSSEASNCPHCGFPIKSPPKDEGVPIVREANSSKSGLGTFFIVLGIISIIIGFIANQPSDLEGLQQNLVKTTQEGLRTQQSLSGAMGVSSPYTDQDRQEVKDAQASLDTMVSQRHMKAACFFISGGVLFILGLVLRASAKPNS